MPTRRVCSGISTFGSICLPDLNPGRNYLTFDEEQQYLFVVVLSGKKLLIPQWHSDIQQRA